MKNDISSGDDWFEKAVLISGQMKVGGTLFSCMLDGSSDFFVLPDIPEFRILFQKEYENNQHMAYDWALGFNNIFQGTNEPLFNFDPSNEKTTIPLEYTDLPLSKFTLRGFFRGLDSWENYFSMNEYHQVFKDLLEKGVESKKDVVRSTVIATIAGCQDKNLYKNISRWGYRGIQSALTSIFKKVQLQDNEVEEFFKTFSQGQAIFQVRTPHAIVLSLDNHYKKVRSSFGKIHRGISFLNDCKIVHESLKMTIEFQNKYSFEKLMTVKYEDLIKDPEDTMTKICHFLDINYSKILTSPTLLGQPSRVITAFETDGLKVDKSKSDKWRKKISPFRKLIIDSFIVENIDDYKKLWGYDTYFPKPLAWMFRIVVLIPFLFICENVGGRILWLGRWLRKLSGLGYLDNKDYANVELLELDLLSYKNLYGDTSLHYIEKVLARIAEKNKLDQYVKVLIAGTKRNLFALSFAQKANSVHVVNSDLEFLEYLQNTGTSKGLKNITTFHMLIEDFRAQDEYDLIYMQDDFEGGQKDHELRIKRGVELMNFKSKIVITGPGIGHPLVNIICNVRERRYRVALKNIMGFLGSILFNKLLKQNTHSANFFSKKEFESLLQKNGLRINNIDFIDTVLEGTLPYKVGPFVRKWEALCEKKDN
jgi:hypothetical protein